jgi:hypothetical protein
MAYKHIFLSGNVRSEKYKTPLKTGAPPVIPPRDRIVHSQKLLQQFDTIWHEKERMQQQREAEQISTREGTYLSFTSAIAHDLITKSLEDLGKGIRLLNITELSAGESEKKIRAIVYVPNGKEWHFITKIQKYQLEETPTGEPKNAPLVNSIEDVSIAFLEGLWTDNPQLIPSENAKWCEVWLNVNTKENKEQEQIAQFIATLESIGIEVKRNSIIFPERAVLLIYANRNQLIELMLQSDLLAEFRAGQEPAGFWVNESRIEQQDWVDDLLKRIEIIESNIKVCLLDSGVNSGHQLLQPIIDDANTLTVDSAWGTNDHEIRTGHGTLMAGIAGYGKMEEALIGTNRVQLTHELCSVKILPPPFQDETRKELWGAITAQGIARAEIQNPGMVLIYCLSLTAIDDVKMGRPSSWSGAIDKISFGEGEAQRLILISAGNIKNYYPDLNHLRDYPNINYTSSVQNPAQSWNALTIGAFTDKVHVEDDSYADYKALAGQGELSPHSTASLSWETKWPIKPDVVFEGGNLLKAPDENITSHEDLELLSTSKSFHIKPFDTISATSAAVAQASWFAAKIAYEYPNAWPETIRGLMVHSANWNDAMKNQIVVRPGNRSDFKNLIKVFGYGVPDLHRALYSQESAFTFIAQEYIQPFGFNDKKNPETNEIHFFNLPWPSELLLSLGDVPVRLRITLSYFVEPGAGEIGWKDKYRYQSHGLRFDINNINDSEEVFRKKINASAREKDDQLDGNTGNERWIIGVRSRSNGSIHSDYMELTAAELANCNLIAVYPVIGWWRERKHLGKVETSTRYSLIVSLDTPLQDIQLYSTVINMIQVPIEIRTD